MDKDMKSELPCDKLKFIRREEQCMRTENTIKIHDMKSNKEQMEAMQAWYDGKHARWESRQQEKEEACNAEAACCKQPGQGGHGGKGQGKGKGGKGKGR